MKTWQRALALGALTVVGACSSSSTPGAGLATGCQLKSDCNPGLVCGFGRCHVECNVSTDCTKGENCVKALGINVCQLPQDTSCASAGKCPEPLVCAVDSKCRNPCQAGQDCTDGQRCANGGVCAEPAEVDSSGNIRGATSNRDAGNGGAGGANGSGGTGGAGGTRDAGENGGSSTGGASDAAAGGSGGSGGVGAAPFDVTVGSFAHGVAVVPDGSNALIALGAAPGAVKVVSLSTYSVVATIPVDDYPGEVAVTPDGTRAVVAHLHSVSVIAPSSNSLITTIPSPCVGDTLYDIETTPDSGSAITTMLSGGCIKNTLAVISLATNSISATYPLAQSSAGLGAIAPDGASALLNLGVLGTSVLRVGLPGAAITTISNTSSSYGIAVLPSGAEALVASGDGDTVKRISLSTNSVTGVIDFASNTDTHNIAVTPDGTRAVVVGSFEVGLLSLSGAGSVMKSWSLGGGVSVAITPDGTRALVTHGDKLRVYTLP